MAQRCAARRAMPLVALLLVAALAVPARAATPSPSASDVVPPDELRFSAWLDQPLPESAPSGASINVGAFLADSTGRVGLSGTAMQARLHSAAPDVEPTVAQAFEDWPGHLTTTLVVPAPIGRLEFILPGSSCDASGCTPSDVVILPTPGAYVVHVAVVQNGGRDDLFSTGIRRITAEDDAAASPIATAPPGVSGDGRDQLPDWVGPALGISGAIAVLLMVFGRRRDPGSDRSAG